MIVKGSACIEVVNNQLSLVEVDGSDFVNEVVTSSLNSNILINKYILNESRLIKELSYTYIFINVSSVYFFDTYSKWVKLKGTSSLTAYHYLSAEICFKDGTYLYLNNKKPFAIRLFASEERLYLTIIHDAPYLHPTWNYAKGQRVSTALKEHLKGTSFLAELKFYFTRSQKKQFIPLFYPFARACFVLTDHCDFDSVEKIKLFLQGNVGDGWLGKGLKITKGVFRFGPKSNEVRKSDDLEVASYSTLINLLYNDGSEICPHALKHSGQLERETFLQGLNDLQSAYKPRTWIDHGSYLKYCYSQNGHLNEDYRLLNILYELNYSSLWSFHDISLDPSYSLNYFHKKKYSYFNCLSTITRHLLRGRVLISAHYFRSLIHKAFPDSVLVNLIRYLMGTSKGIFIAISRNPRSLFGEILKYIKQIFKFDFKRASENGHYSLEEINTFSSPVFTDNHQTINNYTTGLFFFNTIETTHTKDIYRKDSLEKLISECGIHLGHTYILNVLPYINGIFSKRDKKLILSSEWIDFTNYLCSKIQTKELWNPTMAEFSERIKLILNIEVDHSQEFISIKNNNNVQVDDFTVIDSLNIRHSVQLKPFARLQFRWTDLN